jgi:hypothetical protein
MTQGVKKTDQAIDAVDKIVDLGRKICEEKRKHQNPDQLPSKATGKERDNRPLSANEP